MAEMDRVWLACAIDGEGYITINISGYGSSASPIVGVTNTDVRFIKKCAEITGIKNIYMALDKKHPSHKPSWIWQVRSLLDAESVLKQVLPHLILKHEQAAIALELIVIRVKLWGAKPTAEQYELKKKIHALNAKGLPNAISK